MSIAYVMDDIFAEHRPPGYHPERPERLAAVRDALAGAGLAQRANRLPTRPATEEELARVHAVGYLDDLRRVVQGQSGWLDPDTYYSPGTYRAALCAAGAAVDVTAAVVSGRATYGLAIVRPPGHHAETDRAMGFCLLNNVAVAAEAARAGGVGRIAIVDWDVHHGNGTQQAFFRDPDVLYLSCHQYPYFPGSGAPGEVGAGPGAGATVNVALAAGCGDADYVAVFDELLLPEMRRFAPDLVISSMGFDSYVEDPLAGMRVTAAGYQQLARRLCKLAEEVCGRRLVCVLEGGYHPRGLADGMVAVLDAMDPVENAGGGVSESLAARSVPTSPAVGTRAAIAATEAALAAVRGAP